MTLTLLALLVIALVALWLIGTSTSPLPRRIRADDERARPPDDFEISVTDYRGDVDDGSPTFRTWATAGGVLLTGLLAVLAAAEL